MKNNNTGFSVIGKSLTRNEMKKITGGGIIVGPIGEKDKVCSFYCSPCAGTGDNCKTTGVCC